MRRCVPPPYIATDQNAFTGRSRSLAIFGQSIAGAESTIGSTRRSGHANN
jgi:hypothetical protein